MSKISYIEDTQTRKFAEACYNDNSVSELRAAMLEGPDQYDCQAWNITPQQWKEAISAAKEDLSNDEKTITSPTIGKKHTSVYARFNIASQRGLLYLSETGDAKVIRLNTEGWENLLTLIGSDRDWEQTFSGICLDRLPGSLVDKIELIWKTYS